MLLVTVMHETTRLKHLLHCLKIFLLLMSTLIRTLTLPHGLRLKREKRGNAAADGVTGGGDVGALKGSMEVTAMRTVRASNSQKQQTAGTHNLHLRGGGFAV